MRKPVAHELLVVREDDRGPSGGSEREPWTQRPAALVQPAGLEVAAVQRDPLAHPDQPMPACPAASATPEPSSDTSSSTASARVADDDTRPRRPGVLEGVGQGLLDDPVRAQVDARRQRDGIADDVERRPAARLRGPRS